MSNDMTPKHTTALLLLTEQATCHGCGTALPANTVASAIPPGQEFAGLVICRACAEDAAGALRARSLEMLEGIEDASRMVVMLSTLAADGLAVPTVDEWRAAALTTGDAVGPTQ